MCMIVSYSLENYSTDCHASLQELSLHIWFKHTPIFVLIIQTLLHGGCYNDDTTHFTT